MRVGTILLALVASLLPSLLAIRAVVITVPQFSDPCFQWGAGSQTSSFRRGTGSFSQVTPRGDPCASGRGGTSETKTQAIVRLLIVPGGIMVAVALGILGAANSRPALAVFGAGLMFLESIPLVFTIGQIAVFTSAAFLLVARCVGPVRGSARILARILGVVALVFALNAVRLTISLTASAARPGAVPLLLLLQIAVLLFVAGAGWWPDSRASSAGSSR